MMYWSTTLSSRRLTLFFVMRVFSYRKSFLFYGLPLHVVGMARSFIPGFGWRYSLVLVIMSITALAVVSTFY